MSENQKAANLVNGANGNPMCFRRHKGTKHSRRIQHSETKNAAYASTVDMRQTEMVIARQFFTSHPSEAFSRADLVDSLGKPVNHITRIVADLLNENFIEVSGRILNHRTGKTVEAVRLKPHTMIVSQPSLFGGFAQ